MSADRRDAAFLGLKMVPKTVIMRVKYTPLIRRTQMVRNCEEKQEWSVSLGDT